MQLLAMATMLIDHVGFVWFPGEQAWRIIGRLAFPIYAFGIVQGFTYTRDRKKYMNRLVWLAAISQLPFMLGLQLAKINVIATFVVCLAVLTVLESFKSRWLSASFVLAALIVLELLPFDYGAYALLLILIYRYMPRKSWIGLHMLLNIVVFIFVQGWQLEVFSVLGTVLIICLSGIPKKLSVPRWIWRSFYPAHLAILAIILSVNQGLTV